MCPNPMGPVWGRLDNDPPVFFADRAAAEFPPGAWERVLGLGLLRELPPSNSAACSECGTGFPNRIFFLPSGGPGGVRPVLQCRECGPIPLDPAVLRRWAVDVPAVAAAVLRLAGGTGHPAEAVLGRLWHLGRINAAGRSRDAYLARAVHAEARAGVAAALAGRPAAVVFVPTEAAAGRWGTATRNPVVALEAAVTLGPAGLTFDPTAVDARLPGGAPVERAPRPKKRAGPATTNERLTAALVAHLRAARAHALATADQPCGSQLLPRPTMQFLADEVGVSPPTVTRRFREPAGRVLRLYWEWAADIHSVLNFRPIGGGKKG